MSISIIGDNGSSIASATNPVPVYLPENNSKPSVVMFSHLDSTLDSFERLRVSNPQIAFEYGFVNGINSTYWDHAAYGAGTILPTVVAVGAAAPTLNNDWTTNLNTTTASGTGYWIQSLSHVRYAPGISTIARFTFNATVAQANQVVRIGLFTDQGTFPSNAGDGIYFELVGTTAYVTRRTLTGGGVGAVEQIDQANWNMDKMNGTGDSGINLDWTKTQHLVIEYQWLGVGTIRWGWETGSTGIVWCHNMATVNNLALPWSRTGSLPVRAEIYTTGVTAQAGLLKLSNVSVIQEGNVTNRGWRYHTAPASVIGLRTLLAASVVNSWYPLLSIRPATTNDATKRTTIIPQCAYITPVTLGTGPTGYAWGLYYGGNPSGATFASWGSENVQIDTAGSSSTAITGGFLLASGILQQTANSMQRIDLTYLQDSMVRIANNAAGSLTTSGACVLSLCITPLGANSSAAPTFFASLDWKELL